MEGGDWLKDRFQWKRALGPAVDRPGHYNENWGYWSSDGVYYIFRPFAASVEKSLGTCTHMGNCPHACYAQRGFQGNMVPCGCADGSADSYTM